jgi:hypothetical protein
MPSPSIARLIAIYPHNGTIQQKQIWYLHATKIWKNKERGTMNEDESQQGDGWKKRYVKNIVCLF